MLVVAAKDGEFTPEAARASGKDIVLVQSGIHAGEIEGKDAALMLLRDLSVGGKHANLLDHAILVWLPIFNVDGHENSQSLQPHQPERPRRHGLSRDRAEPQSQPRLRQGRRARDARWLAMFDAWLPDLFMDIHTTDGADYQYDLTWYMEEWGPLNPAVKAWQDTAFKQSIFPAFDRMGHMQAPYLDLVDHRDITKGIDNFGSGPRFSTGYVALRNRAALLVETHMLKIVRSARARDVRSRRRDARHTSTRTRARCARPLTRGRCGHRRARKTARAAARFQDDRQARHVHAEGLRVQAARRATSRATPGSPTIRTRRRPTRFRPIAISSRPNRCDCPPRMSFPPQWTDVIDKLAAARHPDRTTSRTRPRSMPNATR